MGDRLRRVLRVDGEAVSASLLDFGLYAFHNIRERVARGSDFGQDGVLKSSAEGKVVHLDRPRAEALVSALEDATNDVRSVEAKIGLSFDPLPLD